MTGGNDLRHGYEDPQIARQELAATGSPAANAIPEAASHPYIEGKGAIDSDARRSALLVAAGIVAVVLVLVVLFAVQFVNDVQTGTIGAPGTNTATYQFPNNSDVTLKWTSGGGVVSWVELNESSYGLYYQTGTSGSFAFTALSGLQYVLTVGAVSGSSVSVSYTFTASNSVL